MTKTRFFAPLAAVALLATGAAPAFAKAQDSGGGTSASALSDKEARKTCKRFDHSASRLLSERLCYTKSNWKKFDSTY